MREINDRLRQSGIGGKVIVSGSVVSLGTPLIIDIFLKIRDYALFAPEDTAHDRGSFPVGGHEIYWRISSNPALVRESKQKWFEGTEKVLFILRGEEYEDYFLESRYAGSRPD